jgi:hypothetical protein
MILSKENTGKYLESVVIDPSKYKDKFQEKSTPNFKTTELDADSNIDDDSLGGDLDGYESDSNTSQSLSQQDGMIGNSVANLRVY